MVKSNFWNESACVRRSHFGSKHLMVCSARDKVRGVADVVGLPLLASWDVPGLGPLSGVQTKTRACHSKVQRPCFPRNEFFGRHFLLGQSETMWFSSACTFMLTEGNQ